MLDDAVVLFADWLSGAIDSTAAVNVLLPNVARRAGDPAPPAVQAVYDEVRSAWVIRGDTEPDVVPALVVVAQADVSLTTLGGERASPSLSPERQGAGDSPLVVAISYAIRQTDLVPAVSYSGYTRKAVRQSIGRLIAAPGAQRTMNNTQLIGIPRVTERRLVASNGNSTLMGVVLAVCLVRDLAP